MTIQKKWGSNFAFAGLAIGVVLFLFAGFLHTLVGSFRIIVPIAGLAFSVLGLVLSRGKPDSLMFKWESSIGIFMGAVYFILFLR